VTNGYLTEESVAAMKGLIDAAVVDFKGNGEQKFSNKFEAVVSSDPIKEALVLMHKNNVHIEITDLIIPNVGDSLEACDELTKWIAKNLGEDTPIHFTRFYPDYKMPDYKATPLETLEKHYSIARKNGLNYVYIGNVVGNPLESTYCANCGNVAVKRYGYLIEEWNIDKHSRCTSCKSKIPMTGTRSKVFENPRIISLY
jgi:pyruvate formate lyase activating enzyme